MKWCKDCEYSRFDESELITVCGFDYFTGESKYFKRIPKKHTCKHFTFKLPVVKEKI